MKIIRNAIRCNLCGEEIESRQHYDLRYCSCGACGVDGGQDYLRRLYKVKGCYTEISVTEPPIESEDKV